MLSEIAISSLKIECIPCDSAYQKYRMEDVRMQTLRNQSFQDLDCSHLPYFVLLSHARLFVVVLRLIYFIEYSFV